MRPFFTRLGIALSRFMQGRHGPDALARACVAAGFAFSLAGIVLSLTPVGRVLGYIGFALYAWAVFRMLSRNNEARWKENARYTAFMGRFGLWRRQTAARLRNLRRYRYFRCPECGAPLRLPRGSGEGTVTCGKCGHRFRMKA